jgi:hypothetical protein
VLSWLPFACVGLALTVLTVLAYRRRWRWAGFAEIRRDTTDDAEVQPAKTLWDWLQLLVIPLALAALAFLLNSAQSSREQRREDERTARQRAIAADAAREEVLRGYLAQMSGLMLDRRLLRSQPGADVRAVARTITLTTVRRLDGERRGSVVQFLSEARLLHPRDPRVALHAANLRSADLRGAFLPSAGLNGADLRRADLRAAVLWGADLGRADLRGADLRRTRLRAAGLRLPGLRDANLSEAKYDSTTRWPRGFDPAAAGATKLPAPHRE